MRRVRDAGQLRMFILDVLRHDVVEALGSILNLLNNTDCIGWREFWPADFVEAEVVSQLNILISLGYVQALRESPEDGGLVPMPPVEIVADANTWFALTNAGRQAWSSWIPPASLGDFEG